MVLNPFKIKCTPEYPESSIWWNSYPPWKQKKRLYILVIKTSQQPLSTSGANSEGEISKGNVSFEWIIPVRVNNRWRFPDKIAHAKDIFLSKAFPVFAHVNVSTFPFHVNCAPHPDWWRSPAMHKVRKSMPLCILSRDAGSNREKDSRCGSIKKQNSLIIGEKRFLPNPALQQRQRLSED